MNVDDAMSRSCLTKPATKPSKHHKLDEDEEEDDETLLLLVVVLPVCVGVWVWSRSRSAGFCVSVAEAGVKRLQTHSTTPTHNTQGAHRETVASPPG